MAILVNMGKRGFILKEGFLKPGEQLTVDAETAEKLTKAYPQELKQIIVQVQEVKNANSVEEKIVEPTVAKEVVEPIEENRVKKATRQKKGSK